MHSVSIFRERNQLANSLLSFHQMLWNFTVQWTSLWLRSKIFSTLCSWLQGQICTRPRELKKWIQSRNPLRIYTDGGCLDIWRRKLQVQRNALVKTQRCGIPLTLNQLMQSNCTRKPVVKTITCDSLHCLLFRTKQRKIKLDLTIWW